MKKTLLIILACSLFPFKAYSAAGSSLLAFLKLDTSARAASMGSALAGICGDINSLNYNPAGLHGIPSQAEFTNNWWFGGVSQEYIAVSLGTGIGISANRISYGQSQRTTVSNPLGSGLGKYSSADDEIKAAIGFKVGEKSLAGMSIKYVEETIDNFAARGAAMDIGFFFRDFFSGVNAGLVARNIGIGRLRYLAYEENFPAEYELAASCNAGKVLACAALSCSADGGLAPSAGVEYFVSKLLSVRVGYSGRNNAGTGISLGAGFGIMDCSITDCGTLGFASRLTLSYKFSD